MSHEHQKKNYDGFIRFSTSTDKILKKIQKYKNDQLAVFGLRSMHLMFLYCLAHSDDGMTPSELAKSCSVDKAFISRITAELRDLGYVEYDSETGSEITHYKKRLSLTQKGRDVMSAVNESVQNAVNKIADGISPHQLETFYHVLDVFDGNLELLAEEN